MYDLFTSDEPHFLCQETCTGVLSGVFRHFIHKTTNQFHYALGLP